MEINKEFKRLLIPYNLGNKFPGSICNIQEEAIRTLVSDITKKKDAVILERLKELGIDLDMKKEQSRRFKRFVSETRGEEETIYYNNGSEYGQRVITFITKQKPFDRNDFSISYEVAYY